MVQLIFVKVTVHPALYMVTTERREWDAGPGDDMGCSCAGWEIWKV
jgi:hypothetical protein